MRLTALQQKRDVVICGLMSGTSCDGIDAALVRCPSEGVSAASIEVIACETLDYDAATREQLFALAKSPSLAELTRTNIALGMLFAESVRRIARTAGLDVDEIDCVGSHGHTVHHAPELSSSLGMDVRGTLQIGDPAVIAAQTGIVTIGDFRVADCALGGEGAPLIPLVDHLLFHSTARSRVMLNIGGIANVTVLPRGDSIDDVWGFDTGPGNTLIDAACRWLFDQPFDKNGTYAGRGIANTVVVDAILAHPYFSRVPPKSTGRELFGYSLVEGLLPAGTAFSPYDVLATLTEITARSIADACSRFVAPEMEIDELIVSGGGAHNPSIMRRLAELLPHCDVGSSDAYGIPVDAKEAVGFALLANECIHERPGNLPRVSGASRRTILGKICL